MAGRLATEIRQKRPMTPEEEALLNLHRTAGELAYRFAELLRPHGLSATQYNVLRILRGAGDTGLPCGEIATRMITRDSDVTRLLDRLEARELVVRSRDSADRRVIVIRITADGLALLASLDAPVARFHVDRLGHLGKARLRQLVDLLEEARSAPD